MNRHLLKLQQIANAPSRVIIGLMSGTSLDGLDIALCEFKGAGIGTSIKTLNFKTISYSPEFKAELRSISSKLMVDLQKVTLLNAYIGTYFAELILQCLEEWKFPVENVDLIASHGQTIFHAPISIHGLDSYPNATLQIGDGDHIAFKTGVITLSDFRQKHIAAGGEGAPLAVYGDYLLFSSLTENRILLNIGGIANFTFLPAGKESDLIFSSDVGPGNTMMDQFVQTHYKNMYYDEDSKLALAGSINKKLLDALLDTPFYDFGFPKTTGPELFSLDYLNEAIKRTQLQGISNEDIMATLSEFTVQGIVRAIEQCVPKNNPFTIYLSGGGMHNPLLVKKIGDYLNCELKTTADLDINPDAKEAILFALLANECIAGEKPAYKNRPEMPATAMGKISFPD
ncbi:anhydro-N-acetylmuramic acid kinase [Pedobacter sp. LMG 31464]|uniref:Anhydro-N-acetylmuramic acid kinase n=1 Tax=Pedobacter planticolens TaxID=2679964 RepID=A0A923ITN8_9SPHI|nr:anhydro-N-acetylmuramic acid kinase [Pedobacter planticolens]MBB2143863.1 anhydro-N-acetylmuramic acid kinase [Pedobacter planticolens]